MARTVRDTLNEARNATSPADTVKHLFMAIQLQQQQIELLELAVGLQDLDATEGIRGRPPGPRRDGGHPCPRAQDQARKGDRPVSRAKRFRSAVTGRFVGRSAVTDHPETTVTDTASSTIVRGAGVHAARNGTAAS
jgi:hypothetical protein